MDEVTRIFIFAIAFSISAVVLVLLSFIISRRRKLQHEKQLLEKAFQTRTAALLQVSRDLHDDIGSSLSGINLLTHLAQEKLSAPYHTETKELLQKINLYTNEVIEKVSDMAWLLKPDQESFSILVNKIKQFAVATCQSKDIGFTIVDSKDIQTKHLTLPQRKAIYLISKEAINNAVKYAGCSTLLFEISGNQERCLVKISDNGHGFEEQDKGSGNGLINMRARAEEIGAVLNIRSSPDAGTMVEIIVEYR
ncbi:MAG: ATP-binding protein [Chitinophagaceae bacterium]